MAQSKYPERYERSALACSAWLYRLFLRAYPAPFGASTARVWLTSFAIAAGMRCASAVCLPSSHSGCKRYLTCSALPV